MAFCAFCKMVSISTCYLPRHPVLSYSFYFLVNTFIFELFSVQFRQQWSFLLFQPRQWKGFKESRVSCCRMTMWKHCDSVKGVARSDEPTASYRIITVSFSSLLSCQAAASLFCFTLSALMALFLAAVGSCFQYKSSKNSLCTTCSAPNSRQIQLAASWWT